MPKPRRQQTSTTVSIRWLTWAIVTAGASRVLRAGGERAVAGLWNGARDYSGSAGGGGRGVVAAPCGAPDTCRRVRWRRTTRQPGDARFHAGRAPEGRAEP